MKHLPDFIQRLIVEFDKLPGIGPKTATRLVFNLLHRHDDIKSLANALNEAHQNIHFCPECYNLTDDGLCSICNNPQRDKKTICIVAHNQDVEAVEKTGDFEGVYHLLNGLLSPLEGITPDKLKITELTSRIKNNGVKEIILALDQSMEGEATTIYISKLLAEYSVTVSRLARGIPMGANIEYTDEVTLSSAIKNRKKL
ncbi:recombination protein RecR [Candidatus Parcubacteria bacterium]|jgi:recombination protein RecR|nr:recombination protein RecR [Candidatus Parcubacteria bacterium]